MPRTVAPHPDFCPRSADSRAPGFTLIELLVTMSIIAILAAISIPVMTAVLRAAEATRMQASLAGLRSAAEEYQAATGTSVDHTVVGFPSAPAVRVEDKDVAGNNTIQLFVFEAGRVPAVASILVSTGRDQLKEVIPPAEPRVMADPSQIANPAHIQLLDVYGNSIRYAAFVDKDDAFTDDDYLPGHPTPFFASPGPDGLWGSVNRSGEPNAEAEDNLYSFDDL